MARHGWTHFSLAPILQLWSSWHIIGGCNSSRCGICTMLGASAQPHVFHLACPSPGVAPLHWPFPRNYLFARSQPLFPMWGLLPSHRFGWLAFLPCFSLLWYDMTTTLLGAHRPRQTLIRVTSSSDHWIWFCLISQCVHWPTDVNRRWIFLSSYHFLKGSLKIVCRCLLWELWVYQSDPRYFWPWTLPFVFLVKVASSSTWVLVISMEVGCQIIILGPFRGLQATK